MCTNKGNDLPLCNEVKKIIVFETGVVTLSDLHKIGFSQQEDYVYKCYRNFLSSKKFKKNYRLYGAQFVSGIYYKLK